MTNQLRVLFFISAVFWMLLILLGGTPLVVGLIFFVGSIACLFITDDFANETDSANG